MTGGIVLGLEKKKGGEKIHYISEDVHSYTIGMTRCGKTRCLILPSIGLLGYSGESMIISDPKGELHDYTADFLMMLGYEVSVLDFREPTKSDCYNFLQPVIDAVSEGDIQKAIDKTWDITESIMPRGDKTEPIWKNGEASIIASTIMAVVYDNQNSPEYQTMANVYYFISQMCKPVMTSKGSYILPLELYVKNQKAKNPGHPALLLISISELAPHKTRSSFYTSALTTLKLFTSLSINAMTSSTTINVHVGEGKKAIYIILPDERRTYYSIASLFVHQTYIELIQDADRNGGVLKNRVNYILEEAGNFSEIPNIEGKLTAGGGRRIRFNFFVQSYAQFDEVYGKEISRIIRDNCEYTLYLGSIDIDTLEDLSKRMGDYTITSYSLSSNHQKYTNPTSGSNVNITGRKLLNANDIRMIKRPYMLVLDRSGQAVMKCPDISEWSFHEAFSMGSKEHNQKLRVVRSFRRKRKITVDQIAFWDLCDYYIEQIQSF